MEGRTQKGINHNKMKKILVVDDSAVMRNLMSVIIEKEPNVCVEDMAEDGIVATQLLQQGKPYDLILLDIKMPRLDGVGVLEFMNSNGIHIPTLVVSSIASMSAADTMRALELGAYDFVKKPGASREPSLSEFQDQLTQRIHCAFRINSDAQSPGERTEGGRARQENRDEPEKAAKSEKEEESASAAMVKPKRRRVSLFRRPVSGADEKKLIFIASSTGGPKALQSVIPVFPEDIGCPIVVVQHMPEGFTNSLAERLNEMSRCEVREAEDGALLENGVVYVAKGGHQLRIVTDSRNEHRFSVGKDAPRNGLRPCADIFLESLVDTAYKKFFCAVLTGMGSDATQGLLQLKKKKEVYTVSQNKQSCVVYGMPRAAVEAGVADDVAELTEVGKMLTQMAIQMVM